MEQKSLRVVAQEYEMPEEDRAAPARDKKLNIAVSEEEKDACATEAARHGVDANTFARQWLRYATGLPSLVGALSEKERES